MTSVQIRDRIYVALIHLATSIAPANTREIHHEIVRRGTASMNEALNATLADYSQNPR